VGPKILTKGYLLKKLYVKPHPRFRVWRSAFGPSRTAIGRHFLLKKRFWAEIKSNALFQGSTAVYNLRSKSNPTMETNSYSFIIGPLITLGFVFLALIVLLVVSQWKIFSKAGQPGWACLIPIYNMYVLLKIVGKPGWWLVLLLIPVVNLVFVIWTTNLLSKSFGKDEGFTAGLLCFGFIFYPILGFGKAKYLGPYGDKAAFAEYQNRNQFEFEDASLA
jgi:magnesium-transporting ATPase (P-type)